MTFGSAARSLTRRHRRASLQALEIFEPRSRYRRRYLLLASGVLLSAIAFGAGCGSGSPNEELHGTAKLAAGVEDATCVTIQRGTAGAVEDATIWEAFPTWSDSTVLLRTGTLAEFGVRHAVLRFDLSPVPAGANVVSATLRLEQIFRDATSSSTINLHRILSPWTESTVTWQSLGNGSDFDAAIAASFQSLPGVGIRSADLTSLAAAWLAGTVPNHGVLLEEAPVLTTSFPSSEEPQVSRRPSLEVCYTTESTCTGTLDDGDACTTDTCDPVLGIVHTPISTDDSDPSTIDTCDPATGAVTHVACPALDPTVATRLIDAVGCIYQGPSAPQTGVTATFDPGTVAVVEGKVATRAGVPISGVQVSVLGHDVEDAESFGRVLTRADGAFELVVRGGKPLTISYEKAGYLPSQRQVATFWQRWSDAPDVVLIERDPVVTPVELGSATEIQVARGSVQTDESGTRQATLLFPPRHLGDDDRAGPERSAGRHDDRGVAGRGARARHRVHGRPERPRSHAGYAASGQRVHLCGGARARRGGRRRGDERRVHAARAVLRRELSELPCRDARPARVLRRAARDMGAVGGRDRPPDPRRERRRGVAGRRRRRRGGRRERARRAGHHRRGARAARRAVHGGDEPLARAGDALHAVGRELAVRAAGRRGPAARRLRRGDRTSGQHLQGDRLDHRVREPGPRRAAARERHALRPALPERPDAGAKGPVPPPDPADQGDGPLEAPADRRRRDGRRAQLRVRPVVPLRAQPGVCLRVGRQGRSRPRRRGEAAGRGGYRLHVRGGVQEAHEQRHGRGLGVGRVVWPPGRRPDLGEQDAAGHHAAPALGEHPGRLAQRRRRARRAEPQRAPCVRSRHLDPLSRRRRAAHRSRLAEQPPPGGGRDPREQRRRRRRHQRRGRVHRHSARRRGRARWQRLFPRHGDVSRPEDRPRRDHQHHRRRLQSIRIQRRQSIAGNRAAYPTLCTTQHCGLDGPATKAWFIRPRGLTVTPGGEILIADANAAADAIIVRLKAPFPGVAPGNITVPSEDGTEYYVFDERGRHLATKDALLGVTRYQFGYDPEGRLTTVTDVDGQVTTIQRDASGVATAIVAPTLQATSLAMNAEGYLWTLTNPANETTTLEYYPGTGLLMSMLEPLGLHEFEYDEGRLIRDDDPADGFKTLSRTDTSSGYSVTLTTAEGRTRTHAIEKLAAGGEQRTHTGWNGLSTVVQTDPSGSRTITTPDGVVVSREVAGDPRFGVQSPIISKETITTPLGRQMQIARSRAVLPPNDLDITSLTETVTVNNKTFSSVFSKASSTLVSTMPSGRQVTTTLNAQGRVAEIAIPGILPIGVTYHPDGQLHTLAQGSRTWTYTYEDNGWLTTMTQPLNHTTSLVHDPVGRVTQVTRPDDEIFGMGYHAGGLLHTVTPPNRPAHSFDFTPTGLLEEYLAPEVGGVTRTTSWSYDRDRLLTSSTRPGEPATIYTTDPVTGRPAFVTLPLGMGTIQYVYHPTTGNLQSVTGPSGISLAVGYDGALPTSRTWTVTGSGAGVGSMQWIYNNDFRIVSETISGGAATSFGYDADGVVNQAGGLTLSRHPQSGQYTGSSIGVVSDTVTPDAYGGVQAYVAQAGGTTVYEVSVTPDALGRIDQRTETILGQTHSYDYEYDLAGRLTDVVRDGALVAHYDYDANGNRLARTSAAGTEGGTYDDQDRLLTYGTKTYVTSPAGDRTSVTDTATGETTTFTYDALGALRHVGLPDATSIDYLVDGEGQRIWKQRNGVKVLGFLYRSALQPAAELDGAGNVVARFVYGRGQNVPDLMIKGGATYRIFTDHVGSPRLVVNSATGAVAQRMDFDEFGRVLLDTNPGFTPFGFAGGLYDPETKLVRFGVRDYDPAAGRWTSKDPILFAGRSLNVYAYVGNDPINRTDPTGLLPGMPLGFPSLDSADWAGGLATLFNLLTPGAGTDVRWNGGNPIILLTNSPWSLGNAGLTLGHVVALKRDDVRAYPTYKHELAHVDQHDILGAAYLPLHILAQAYSFITTGDYAMANPLEHGPNKTTPCAF